MLRHAREAAVREELERLERDRGSAREAEKLDVEFLGEVPLDIVIRETSDEGRPIVLSQPESEHAQAFGRMASRIWEKLGGQQRPAPKIVVD